MIRYKATFSFSREMMGDNHIISVLKLNVALNIFYLTFIISCRRYYLVLPQLAVFHVLLFYHLQVSLQ